MSDFPEISNVAERVERLTQEQNHAVACTVLKWAARTPNVTREQIEDLCNALGVDLDAATKRGQRERVRGDAITLLDYALQECLTEFCHPNEFGGFDTDSREAATIAVDALLANRELLGEMAGLR